ncbi:alpha/beta hydrolase [Streptomyces boninensis]|uniref:alpha/beta hydrolase n=1 Tax=Streptomyces boninensis TaxID=2039455 RepID=UPI003B21C019
MNAIGALLRTTLNATSAAAPALAGRAAFALFRRPLVRPKLRPHEREVMDSAWYGSTTVNGKNVITYCWGDGERPVLLVHGWQSRAAHFSAHIKALRAAGFSPVAFDAPGHGASGGREMTILEYREIMRTLGVEHGRFDAVIGHSFGALAAFFAVREGAVAADRLVSLAGIPDFGHLVRQFREELGLRPRLEEEVRRRVVDYLFRNEGDIWERFASANRPEEVDVERVLLVHDADDRRAPAELSEQVAAAYGERAQLVVTRGLGHNRILWDAGTTAAVLDFVASPSGAELLG